MVPEGRPPGTAVSEPPRDWALLRDPTAFEFFQAVRLLERLLPERPPVGGFAHPAEEVARFAANPSLSFPASEIQEIEWKGEAPRLLVNFFGLTGPLGVLPYYYTLQVAERLQARDGAMHEFLGAFDHRMISLLYRAWEKYRFTVAYERGRDDRFRRHLMDLVGLGTAGLEKRQAVQDDALLFYAGILLSQPRSAQALRQVLGDYFQVPVEIEEFVGAWYALDEDTQCSLEVNTVSGQVGLGAVVGDEIWDQQSRARIKLGPLSLEQYRSFLPDGAAHEPLRGLTRFFANEQVEFEIQLILQREEVPPCELGGEGGAPPQLGWSSWMKTAPLGRDPGDTILKM